MLCVLPHRGGSSGDGSLRLQGVRAHFGELPLARSVIDGSISELKGSMRDVAKWIRRDPELGIGLAFVRKLVELHARSVTVARDGIGQGSEFTVCLPSERPQGNKQGAQADETRGRRRPCRGRPKVRFIDTSRVDRWVPAPIGPQASGPSLQPKL